MTISSARRKGSGQDVGTTRYALPLLVALLGGSGSAQFTWDWISPYVNRIQTKILVDSFSQDPASPPAVTAAQPAPVVVTLTYQPTAAVREKVTRDTALWLAGGDKQKGASTAAELGRSDLIGQFNAGLKRLDLTPNNLADTFAAYLLTSWEVINGGNAAQHLQGVRATRDLVRRTFGETASVRQLNDAQKQEASETLAYRAVLTTAVHDSLKARGEEDTLLQFREGRRQEIVQTMGWDLKGVRLGPQGFGK